MASKHPDSTQIETRLLLVAEMLDRAVEEVRRAMAEIKKSEPGTEGTPAPGDEVRRTDGNP